MFLIVFIIFVLYISYISCETTMVLLPSIVNPQNYIAKFLVEGDDLKYGLACKMYDEPYNIKLYYDTAETLFEGNSKQNDWEPTILSRMVTDERWQDFQIQNLNGTVQFDDFDTASFSIYSNNFQIIECSGATIFESKKQMLSKTTSGWNHCTMNIRNQNLNLFINNKKFNVKRNLNNEDRNICLMGFGYYKEHKLSTVHTKKVNQRLRIDKKLKMTERKTNLTTLILYTAQCDKCEMNVNITKIDGEEYSKHYEIKNTDKLQGQWLRSVIDLETEVKEQLTFDIITVYTDTSIVYQDNGYWAIGLVKLSKNGFRTVTTATPKQTINKLSCATLQEASIIKYNDNLIKSNCGISDKFGSKCNITCSEAFKATIYNDCKNHTVFFKYGHYCLNNYFGSNCQYNYRDFFEIPPIFEENCTVNCSLRVHIKQYDTTELKPLCQREKDNDWITVAEGKREDEDTVNGYLRIKCNFNKLEDVNLGSNYTFRLLFGNNNMMAYMGNVPTVQLEKKFYASEPRDFVAVADENANVNLSWSPPSENNAPITEYVIKQKITHSEIEGLRNEWQNFTTTNVKQSFQIPGNFSTTYEFIVSAKNQNEGKPSLMERVYTPPAKPTFLSDPTTRCESENHTCVLIIPEIMEKSVRSYIYINPNSEDNNDFSNETCTNNTNIVNINNMTEPIHNLVILNATEASLRNISITKPGSGKKVHILLLNCYFTKTHSSTIREAKMMNTSTLVNLWYLILLIPVAIIGIFTFRYFKFRKNTTREQVGNISGRAGEEQPLYYHVNISNMEMSNLKEKLKNDLIDETHKHVITKRFTELNDEEIKEVNVAKQDENKLKNKFQNILAYDHTRVKLNVGSNESDYINANYIEGYNKPKAYIAAQAPMKRTVIDFWNMIWAEEVKYVFMIANLEENGKKQSEKYWPDVLDDVSFDMINVTTESERRLPFHTERIFTIKKYENEREIKHYQFTAWPDHGVPMYPHMLQPVVNILAGLDEDTPILIHCSAGVGRTGTLILSDIAIKMAKHHEQIDFFHILRKIRSARMKMVQKSAQFILAHLLVYERLFGTDYRIPVDQEFLTYIDTMYKDKKKMKELMDYINDTCWQDLVIEHPFHVPLSDEIKLKTRFPEIYADFTRVILKHTGDMSSDYINANYVDCYQTKHRFITTQQPIPSTVDDFWRMVYETGSHIIISLHDIDLSDPSSCIFWPEKNQSLEVSPNIKLTFIKQINKYGTKHREISMSSRYRNKIEHRKVNLITFEGWHPKILAPSAVKKFVEVLQYVCEALHSNECPIVVACHDSISGCGLFVALSFIMEQIKLEQVFDCAFAVRNIRRGHSQFLVKREHLDFLHLAASEYVKGFTTYWNFR